MLKEPHPDASAILTHGGQHAPDTALEACMATSSAAPGPDARPNAAPRPAPKLTEPQQSLVDSLRAGAQLRHDQRSGKFRLRHNGRERSVQPQTVMALIRMQLLYKDLVGGVTLA